MTKEYDVICSYSYPRCIGHAKTIKTKKSLAEDSLKSKTTAQEVKESLPQLSEIRYSLTRLEDIIKV